MTAIAGLLVPLCLFFCIVETMPSHDTEHRCSGTDCLICRSVSLTERLTDVTAARIGLFSAISFVCVCVLRRIVFLSSKCSTPVYLKVKLSN